MASFDSDYNIRRPRQYLASPLWLTTPAGFTGPGWRPALLSEALGCENHFNSTSLFVLVNEIYLENLMEACFTK